MESKDAMMDSGKEIYNMGLERKFGMMDKLIRDIIQGEVSMESDFIDGLINRLIRVSGFRATFKDKATMFIRMVGLIKDSLLII